MCVRVCFSSTQVTFFESELNRFPLPALVKPIEFSYECFLYNYRIFLASAFDGIFYFCEILSCSLPNKKTGRMQNISRPESLLFLLSSMSKQNKYCSIMHISDNFKSSITGGRIFCDALGK